MSDKRRWRQRLQRLLPSGFNQQVAILSALSLVVALTVFGYVIYRKQNALQEETALNQATIVIRNFRAAAYRDILLANYDEIRELMLHTAEFPEVRRLVVTDNQGRVLGDIRHRPGSDPLESFEQRNLAVPVGGAATARRDGHRYLLWEPVADQGYGSRAATSRCCERKSAPACCWRCCRRSTSSACCTAPSTSCAG